MGEHVGSRCGLRYYLPMPSLELELELDGLRRRYGSVTARDGLSFGMPTGQVFGFLGPNGAGKTTTMRAIFGVAALDAGEIRWRGRPAGDVPGWQVAVSAVLCAAGTVWMARLATRIYTQSILRAGPPIRHSQALRRNSD